jgi:hypothetical protein
LQLVLTFFFLRIDATGYYARFWWRAFVLAIDFKRSRTRAIICTHFYTIIINFKGGRV